MTRICSTFVASLLALSLSACGERAREYPPGYTDDGVKFDEDGWRYFFSSKRVAIASHSTEGRPQMTFSCNLDHSSTDPSVARMLRLQKLEVFTQEFLPLEQWPQPVLVVRVGQEENSGLDEIHIHDSERVGLRAQFEGRERDRLIAGLRQGLPVKLSFADQELEAAGPPLSMREAFAAKCLDEAS